MRNQAQVIVSLAGAPLSGLVYGMIESVTISDKAGTSTDTATIVFNDATGMLQMPETGSAAAVALGKPIPAPLFSGTVEKVTSEGGRNGRRLTVTCRGVDVASKVREPQRRHFDDMSVEEILKEAGGAVGVTRFLISEKFKSMVRDYEAMDNEDLITFGERLAKEVGATFKFRDDTLVFAERGSGLSPSGQPLPVALAARGMNLHTWSVSPRSSRPRYKLIEVRWFDRAAAEWKKVEREVEIEGATTTGVGIWEAANEQLADQRADALKAEMERDLGEGTVVTELTPFAQPEGSLLLIGAKGGIDGLYRVDVVTHEYNRSGASRTTIRVKEKLI